jgi:AraC-like DNA-binding protein
MSVDTSVLDCVRETVDSATTLRAGRNSPFPVAAMLGGNAVARHQIELPRVEGRTVDRSSGIARNDSRDARGIGNDYLLTFEQVIAGAKGESTRLTWLLRELCCCVQLRRIDGIVLPWSSERDDPWSRADAADPDSQNSGSNIEQGNCASIYDPQGQLFAALHLRASEMDRSASLDRLLYALIESVAGAITERWFRLHHRHHWIVAAQRQDRTEKPIALAVDRSQRLVGADRAARQLLGLARGSVEAHLSLSTLFSIGADAFNDAPGCDIALRLSRCSDGAPYSVLITSPDPGAMTTYQNERLLLHTRPRSEAFSHWEHTVLKEKNTGKLPRGRLRRVQEYIDTHLDSALSTDELAAQAGFSASHFSRSFAKSVGMTPHRYVLRRRVMRAQRLLEDSELSMVEIAISTGFSDQSHFCRRFRELVGLPPMAFRRSIDGPKQTMARSRTQQGEARRSYSAFV